jgi:hypothetical protein
MQRQADNRHHLIAEARRTPLPFWQSVLTSVDRHLLFSQNTALYVARRGKTKWNTTSAERSIRSVSGFHVPAQSTPDRSILGLYTLAVSHYERVLALAVGKPEDVSRVPSVCVRNLSNDLGVGYGKRSRLQPLADIYHYRSFPVSS